jgi:hypothetical protein
MAVAAIRAIALQPRAVFGDQQIVAGGAFGEHRIEPGLVRGAALGLVDQLGILQEPADGQVGAADPDVRARAVVEAIVFRVKMRKLAGHDAQSAMPVQPLQLVGVGDVAPGADDGAHILRPAGLGEIDQPVQRRALGHPAHRQIDRGGGCQPPVEGVEQGLLGQQGHGAISRFDQPGLA